MAGIDKCDSDNKQGQTAAQGPNKGPMSMQKGRGR